MLIAKTDFPPGAVIAETARFMDAATTFPQEIADAFRSGMTADDWPAMLSSVIEFMHREGKAPAVKADQQDAEYLARLNAHILKETRNLSS